MYCQQHNARDTERPHRGACARRSFQGGRGRPNVVTGTCDAIYVRPATECEGRVINRVKKNYNNKYKCNNNNNYNRNTHNETVF